MYRLNTTGLDLKLINQVFLLLENAGNLPAKYKTHKLSGDYTGFLECHIQNDWLLVWAKDEDKKRNSADKDRHAQRSFLTK